MKHNQLIFASLLLFITGHSIYAQKGASDPEKARLITSDINNFWEMFDELPKAVNKEDTIQILNDLYINRASSALEEYFEVERREGEKVIEEEYLKTLRQYPKYLASIRSNTENIDNNKDKIYQYFAKAKELYPDFRFHDTNFCIGFFNSGGKSMPEGGLYIGTEMFAMSEETNIEEWKGNDWIQVFAPINHIHNIVLHEQTHFQQLPSANNDYNLLYNAINEGAAVFLVDVVTDGEGVTNGGGVSRNALKYGNANEQKVWQRFKEDMLGYDQSEWFYNADSKEWPKDMGYYVGYRICKYYFDNAKDKKLAIKEILEVTDANEFLKRSEYGSKFE